MTLSLANCICFPKEEFHSCNICFFSSDLTVALHKLKISSGFFLFFLGKQSTDAKRCILSLLSCLFQCHLHNYIQMKSLKLIRTASVLGRKTKECCKARPSYRLNMLLTQCCQLEKLGFDFVCHCTKTNSIFC